MCTVGVPHRLNPILAAQCPTIDLRNRRSMSRISLLSSAASASLLLAGQFHMSLVWMPTYGGSKQSPFNVNSLLSVASPNARGSRVSNQNRLRTRSSGYLYFASPKTHRHIPVPNSAGSIIDVDEIDGVAAHLHADATGRAAELQRQTKDKRVIHLTRVSSPFGMLVRPSLWSLESPQKCQTVCSVRACQAQLAYLLMHI